MAKRKKTYLLAALTLGVLCFIWGNSMLSGEESGAISGRLLAWLAGTFPFLKWLPELLLRKLGHFLEFAALGFLMAWFFRLRGQKGIHRMSMPLLVVLLVAVTDETIQTFSLGRSPSVIDIWIDVAGGCVGIALLLLSTRIYTWIQNRKGEKQ